MQKRWATWALSLFSGAAWLSAPPDAYSQDAGWRSSRSIVVRATDVKPSTGTSHGQTSVSNSPRTLPWRVRADILRHLRAGLALARADVAELERRQRAQRVFRFSDGLQAHEDQTRLTLLAARLTAAGIEAEIRRVTTGN